MKRFILVLSLISILFLAGCSLNENKQNNSASGDIDNQQQEIVENSIFSNEQLIEMVKTYREAKGEYIPEFVVVEDDNNNIVTIHLYDVVDDHTATSDWYYIDRNSGIGEDLLGEKIDLNKITEQENNVEGLMSLKYTSMEDLKNQNVLPLEAKIGEYYNIGSVKLGNNTYDLKYVKETVNDEEAENGVSIEEKLKFYKGEVQKLELLVSTEVWWREYTKEISIFKDKYLVTVSNTNTGDSLQFLEIYDDNLNKVTNYVESEKTIIDGSIEVHCGYENYYLIEDDHITYMYNGYDYTKDVETKVTYSVSEENGSWEINIVDQTTEGVRPMAGRT